MKLAIQTLNSYAEKDNALYNLDEVSDDIKVRHIQTGQTTPNDLLMDLLRTYLLFMYYDETTNTYIVGDILGRLNSFPAHCKKYDMSEVVSYTLATLGVVRKLKASYTDKDGEVQDLERKISKFGIGVDTKVNAYSIKYDDVKIQLDRYETYHKKYSSFELVVPYNKTEYLGVNKSIGSCIQISDIVKGVLTEVVKDPKNSIITLKGVGLI